MPSSKISKFPEWALELLQCPCTGERLHFASEELLSRVAALQKAGRLTTALGINVEHGIECGLVNHSETHFHLVRSGIPTLLPSEAIDVGSL